MNQPRTAGTGVLAGIGSTPLIELGTVVPHGSARVLAKLEWANPTGSMKDRMAVAAIRGAEARGDLVSGDTVVEYTSGTTGVSLALVVLSEPGIGLLTQGGPAAILIATLTSVIAVAALTVATGAWFLGPARWPEQVLLGAGAFTLLVMEPVPTMIGAALIAAGLFTHLVGRRRAL